MKILLQIIFLVLFTLISCTKKKEKKVESDKYDTIEKTSKLITEKDSIIENSDSEPINLIGTRIYAQKILNNEIQPSDNDETFECMNQLITENEEDLKFYFEVFRVIVKKSDGALSEVIGMHIMSFLKYNPDFFIEKYLSFNSDEKDNFIGFIAYEFYFSDSDYEVEIDEFFTRVNKGIKSDSESKSKILTEIKSMVIKDTERILNE